MHHGDPVATSLWLVFLGGLMGSFHCLGMCGPLVALIEGSRPGPWGPWRQVPLHAGRLLTYGLLGALAGAAGGALERGGLALGIQGAASILGGTAMTLFALVILGLLPLPAMVSLSGGALKHFSSLLASRHPWRGLVLGLYWGLLPCGLVWAFLLRAGGAGSVVGGLSVMLVFGAGTVPLLLVAGSLGKFLGTAARSILPRLAGYSVLVIGLLLILRGAAGAGWIAHIRIAPGVPLF